jgi:hypothetical protein
MYALQSVTINEICRILTAKGIPTPENHRMCKAASTPWDISSVCQMLEDPVYIGKYVSHKRSTVSYKNHKRIIRPESDWVVIDNHHPPIVDLEIFEAVQRLRDNRRRYTKRGERSILSGLVRCADCGSTLSYCLQGTNGNTPNFICKTYRSADCHNNHKCTRHGIRVSDLEAIVLKKIKDAVTLARKSKKEFSDKVYKSSNTDIEKTIKSKTAELGRVERRIAELDKVISRTYEDHVIGKLTDERFDKFLKNYEAEQSGLTASAETLRTEIDELKSKTANIQGFMNLVERHGDVETLTERIARDFIDRVIVHEAVFKTGTKRVKLSQEVEVYLTNIGKFNMD